MGFGFLRRKRKSETVSLEEVKLTLLEMAEDAERNVEDLTREKRSELAKEIENLVSQLESLDIDLLHPRLKSQARNFVSAMLKLWKPAVSSQGSEFFNEVVERMEKVAAMRVRYFRMLFAVSSPEIEQIELTLKNIANIVGEVEGRKRELRLPDLHHTLELVRKAENIIEEKEGLMLKRRALTSRMTAVDGGSDDVAGSAEVLQELKAEEDRLAREIEMMEAEVHRKIAYARKPIKIYAHMVGESVNLDTRHLVGNIQSLRALAEGAALEVRKGSIKLKEKNQKAILESLDELASGRLEEEILKIRKLREKLGDVRNEMLRIGASSGGRDGSRKRKEIERRVAAIDDTAENLDRQLTEVLGELEGLVSEILGKAIRLRVKS